MTLGLAQSSRSKWILTLGAATDARIRLFCLPYAGAGTLAFKNWSGRLPSWIQVCPVQLPGREARMREKPIPSASAIAGALAPEMEAFVDKPFAVFGHSMGALIAFELARQLRKAYAIEPHYIFVSARRAPQMPLNRTPIHSMPHHDFVDALRRMGGTPGAVLENTELLEVLSPLLRADFAVHEVYDYADEPPFTCPIMAFGGDQDPENPAGLLEGWRTHTSGTFSACTLPGNHFFLHQQEGMLLGELTAALQKRLAAVA